MVSERIRRQIDRLLNEAGAALAKEHRATAIATTT